MNKTWNYRITFNKQHLLAQGPNTRHKGNPSLPYVDETCFVITKTVSEFLKMRFHCRAMCVANSRSAWTISQENTCALLRFIGDPSAPKVSGDFLLMSPLKFFLSCVCPRLAELRVFQEHFNLSGDPTKALNLFCQIQKVEFASKHENMRSL